MFSYFHNEKVNKRQLHISAQYKIRQQYKQVCLVGILLAKKNLNLYVQKQHNVHYNS